MQTQAWLVGSIPLKETTEKWSNLSATVRWGDSKPFHACDLSLEQEPEGRRMKTEQESNLL